MRPRLRAIRWRERRLRAWLFGVARNQSKNAVTSALAFDRTGTQPVWMGVGTYSGDTATVTAVARANTHRNNVDARHASGRDSGSPKLAEKLLGKRNPLGQRGCGALDAQSIRTGEANASIALNLLDQAAGIERWRLYELQ